MNKATYDGYLKDKLSISDQLAIERTALASERTFLSYLRTMLGLVAIGVTLMEFADSLLTRTAAVCLLGVAVILFFYGIAQYTKALEILHRLENHDDEHHAPSFATVIRNIGKSISHF